MNENRIKTIYDAFTLILDVTVDEDKTIQEYLDDILILVKEVSRPQDVWQIGGMIANIRTTYNCFMDPEQYKLVNTLITILEQWFFQLGSEWDITGM